MFQGYDEQCTPPSEGDLLDSELVRAALENLGLEEEELQYRVSIMDYETGTNHKLEVTLDYFFVHVQVSVQWPSHEQDTKKYKPMKRKRD